jgi:DNA-binding transcriptional MerR regulator
MAPSMPIGDFSRATHMSVKTLRYYHRVGLLEPADVDPFTGHRRYTTDQIPAAQIIRRFRELDMPVEEIAGILTAPDIKARNEKISAHLSRLEQNLARTQRAVAAVRDLLEGPPGPAVADISYRSTARIPAAAITAVVDVEDIGAWYQGASGELRATLSAQRVAFTGPAGGIYATELFTAERGQATVFIPCDQEIRPVGRVEPVVVPPAELAIIMHKGPQHGIDRAYGALASHVTQHALTIDGPIREHYLCGSYDTPDEAAWRTEIGWPIFRTVQR